jgi:glycosyltransferase involved in cell wall biosynthesis
MIIDLNFFLENGSFSFQKLLKDRYKSFYFENVNLGKEIGKNSRVAVVSLARNCEKNLQKSIDIVKKLEFKKLSFFVYENNSTDQTKKILLDNQNDQITISLNTDETPYLTNRSRERTINLAKYRNICLEWVKQNYSDFDYVIVLDLDADEGFSIDGIYNSISWLNKIETSAGMASYSLMLKATNNKLLHYDAFAARINDWAESSVFTDPLEKSFTNYHPDVGAAPIPFYSCFGGLAVYKAESFIYGHYDGSMGCEHVWFHKSMRDKGYGMYLNPSSIFFAVNKKGEAF